MSQLIKKEIICSDCDKHFILVVQEADRYELMSCPFCNIPLPEEEQVDSSEDQE